MQHPPSGVVACDDVSSKLERCARRAYQLAALDPDHPASTADVLAGIFKAQNIRNGIRLVDLGVDPGRAILEFIQSPRMSEPRPVRALMLRRQRRELATFACAHACAQIMDWAHDLHWSGPRIIALAMAVVIPAAPLRAWGESERGDAEALAASFATDVDVVYERLAAVRGSISGERFAITPSNVAP
jgi:hypothetical protein